MIDGWLIDHEPPFQIITRLSDEGIVWNSGDLMEFFDPNTGQLDLVHAPDEVRIEVEQFNKRVLTAEFNRVVCEALAQHIDPSLPEKTLIFCATDSHADVVVDQFRRVLTDLYGGVEGERSLTPLSSRSFSLGGVEVGDRSKFCGGVRGCMALFRVAHQTRQLGGGEPSRSHHAA